MFAAATVCKRLLGSAEVDVEGKIFLGGLTWQTTDDMLKSHFGKWGTLNDVILMRNKMTGEPRGFGFVQFTDSAGEVPGSLPPGYRDGLPTYPSTSNGV